MKPLHALEKTLVQCPFCSQRPELLPWPGRTLICVVHKCRTVHIDRSYLPNEIEIGCDQWNREVLEAQERLLAMHIN